jgi:hypothetical protein
LTTSQVRFLAYEMCEGLPKRAYFEKRPGSSTKTRLDILSIKVGQVAHFYLFDLFADRGNGVRVDHLSDFLGFFDDHEVQRERARIL